MDAGYGQALYFPYIHFNDEKWVKVAALYYDGLSRIVPFRYTPHDSEFIRKLNSETNFIRNICPLQESDEIQRPFLRFAADHLADPQKRAKLLKKLSVDVPRTLAVIHSGKGDLELLYELSQLGLAKYPNDLNQEWFELDPFTGALYMTLLANRMAERRGLPVVTDDARLQPLLRDFQSDTNAKADAALALASMVIETAIPAQLDALTARQIAEFRARSEVQRLRFYEAIREISKEIQQVEDARAYQEQLMRKHTLIADAVADLQRCYFNTGIAFVTGLVSLSVPAWSVSVSKITGFTAMPIVAAGGVAVAIAVQKFTELKRARANSPWSYVLSLTGALTRTQLLLELQSGALLV